MRRLFILAVFSLFIPLGVHAQTATTGIEQINNFDARITVNTDGSILVQEIIRYDLGDVAKHGIYRNLPYQYTRNGASYNLRYHLVSVKDEAGKDIPETTQTLGGYVKIRIGDPNVTITGAHTYVITYTVQRAIRVVNSTDELYWNATGNEWTVPIENATTTIIPPTNASFTNVTCYTGAVGSTATDCAIQPQPDGSMLISGAHAFAIGEGLTFAVALPAGTVAQPTRSQLIRYFLSDNWYLGIPIILWALFHWRWYKRGRDPKGRGTVVPQYEAPDNMPPYLVGVLQHTLVGGKELSATIIHLACRGYLTIADPGKEAYTFTLKKPADPSLSQAERLLMDGLFGAGAKAPSVVKLSDLKNIFYTHLAGIKNAMTQELVSRGYYSKNPTTVRAIAIGLHVLVVFIFGVVIFALQSVVTVASVGSIAVAGVLAVVYGWLMPAKTMAGAGMLEQVQGFKWFLSVTETERLKFSDAPAKKPEQFAQFLPYAMVLGVEKEWAGQFKDLLREPPGWYQGQSGSMFNTLLFVSVMSNMSTNMQHTFVSQPRSAGGSGFGGGGFSGGGFGGGGGGSW